MYMYLVTIALGDNAVTFGARAQGAFGPLNYGRRIPGNWKLEKHGSPRLGARPCARSRLIPYAR